MITCTQCGNANSGSRSECQFCGAPLVPAMYQGDNRFAFPQSSPSQPMPPAQAAQASQSPELPAWLESLRSDIPAQSPGSLSSPSASSGQNFSAADFMEEGDLPRWMQANNDAGGDNVQQPSAPYSLRSSAFSAPNTDEGYARTISAHDLIDEQMLPPWMRGEDKTPSSFEGQRNITASSLLQPDNVPEWMKNFPQSQPDPFGSQGQQRLQGQDAPSWLGDAAFGTPHPSYPPSMPPQQGVQAAPSSFSARDLIDPQSLPQWMREQNVQGGMSNNGMQGGQSASSPAWNIPNQGQGMSDSRRSVEPAMPTNGFSASSLLDMNALPSWMRESEQQAASPSYQQQAASWQTPAQPAMQGQQPTPGMPSQQGVPASSFIDVNALPDWLRAASEQGQATPSNQGSFPYQGVNARNGDYGTPPGMGARPDNVRVPNRPRGEIGMNEGNEAAANAFASMLGVASHAPQFSQGVPNPAQSMQPMASPASQPQQYVGYQNAGGSPFMSPAAPQPVSSGQQSPYTNSIGVAQMPPVGAQPMQNMGNAGQGVGQYNSPAYGSQQQASQEKPQKRGGLFEAIRNFFFRQS